MSAHTSYSKQSEITSLGTYSHLFEDLPTIITGLCEVVQGVMLHIYWAERYGVKVTKERKPEEDLRKVERQLAVVAKRAPTGNPISLPTDKRILGTCRDFSTLLCAMLRHINTPARPRCGFAIYFEEEKFADHWICEYWDHSNQRWRMVDAQLDDFQIKSLGIGFDTTDVPADQFLVAGRAWQLCREGLANPAQFGIMDWQGMWFVKGNLIRDLLSLAKIELLPWDTNPVTGPYEKHTPDDSTFELLDEVARLTTDPSAGFDEAARMIKRFPDLGMPENWKP